MHFIAPDNCKPRPCPPTSLCLSGLNGALCSPTIVPNSIVTVFAGSQVSPSLVKLSSSVGGEVVEFTIWRGNLTIVDVQYSALPQLGIAAIENRCATFELHNSPKGV